MAKDYQQKEPTKFEKYVEYRFETIEHDLINLQRQVSTIARLTKMDPEDFIKALNDPEAYKKFIEGLNKAYEKFRQANPPSGGATSGTDLPVPPMPSDGDDIASKEETAT